MRVSDCTDSAVPLISVAMEKSLYWRFANGANGPVRRRRAALIRPEGCTPTGRLIDIDVCPVPGPRAAGKRPRNAPKMKSSLNDFDKYPAAPDPGAIADRLRIQVESVVEPL